jgi:hypothetical protein
MIANPVITIDYTDATVQKRKKNAELGRRIGKNA